MPHLSLLRMVRSYVHHRHFCSHGRLWTFQSKLSEWTTTGKFCTAKVAFYKTINSKWRCPSSSLPNRRCPRNFFSNANNTTPPSAFPHTIHTETEQKDPNAIPQENIDITQEGSEDWEKEIRYDDVKLLVDFRSEHNYIRVLEVSRRADHPLAGARLLLLDKPGNIHSMYFKYRTLTHSYYDVFGTLPALLPHGTLGILGMGAGTIAHILLHFWPSIDIKGWELDPTVISVGRKFFDLLELERANPDNLGVYVGDALEASVPGGFSGLVVDLFSEGSVIPDLQIHKTWQCLKERLRNGGRIMVNCGCKSVEAESPSRNGHMVMQETMRVLADVFPGEVYVLRLDKEDTSIVLTGPLPNLDHWKQALPSCLRCYVDNWVPVSEFI